MGTTDLDFISQFIELSPDDRKEVISFMEHLRNVNGLNESQDYMESALAQIRSALDQVKDF